MLENKLKSKKWSADAIEVVQMMSNVKKYVSELKIILSINQDLNHVN